MEPTPQSSDNPVEQPVTPTPNPAPTAAPTPTPAAPAPEPSGKGKKTGLLVGLVVLVVVVAAGAAYYFMNKPAAAPAPQARTVKLGIIAPLSGDNVNDGQLIKRGVDMARKAFNQENLTFDVIAKDTQCDADKAAAATKELADDGVVAIIGESCSGATLGALPVANARHIVLISPASSSPNLTVAGDYFFRTYPSDNLQGAYGAKLMYDAGARKVAIIYSNEPYGQGLDTTAKDNFTKLGGTVVTNQSFEDRDGITFDTQLAAIKAAKPDAIYIITNGKSAAAAIILGAKKLGLTTPLYGSETLKDDALLTDVGANANGLTVTAVTEGNPSFVDQYTTAYGAAPASSGGAQAYDAFTALAKVIAAGANTPDEIRTALYKVSFDGMSGHIAFDSTGDLVGGNYKVYVVKDQKYSLVSK